MRASEKVVGFKKSFKQRIKRIIGQPCWGGHYDRQSHFRLSFGNPHLEIWEPGKQTTNNDNKIRKRWLRVEGEWELYVSSAYWRLEIEDGLIVTGSHSQRRIEMALSRLKGERLLSIAVNPRNGMSEFIFDYGAVLTLRRFGPTEEVWALRQRLKKREITVRGDGLFRDGQFSNAYKYDKPNEWLPIV